MFRTATCSLLLLAAVAAAQETTFPITLHRPMTVGARYDVKLKASRTVQTLVKVGGRVANNEEKTVKLEFEGVFEILAVNEIGGPTHFRCFVRRLVVDDQGTVTQPLAAGDRFEAVRDGTSTTYKMDDRTISEELEDVLQTLVNTDDGPPDEDACYGPDDPPSLGDTWTGKPEAISKSLALAEIAVAPADVRATAQLEKIETRWKVPCHRVLVKLASDNVKPPEGQAPEGLTPAKGSLVAEWTSLMPVDAKLSHAHEYGGFTLTMKMRGVNARAGLEVDQKIIITRDDERIRIR